MTERQALENMIGRSRFNGFMTGQAAAWALAEIDRLTAENAELRARLAASDALVTELEDEARDRGGVSE